MELESPDRSDQRWSSSFAEISQSLKSLTASTYCSCSDTMLCMDWTLPFVGRKRQPEISAKCTLSSALDSGPNVWSAVFSCISSVLSERRDSAVA
ncbi:hypothetical protein EYF80_036487 [Liparis tanakae]|uniref:Uncharacterized protein n=1 Tax=Liparis tanakae TaxID=230148 RepID=A0A4Z2GKE6_9TELE|nr:hypothetical protein EYF80_036487 [Liparis tanakae]